MARILTGIVFSNKMPKTAVVLVERKFSHPKYRKVIMKHKRYKVHVDKITVQKGDMVEIQEVRPISKEKRFVITKTLAKEINNKAK